MANRRIHAGCHSLSRIAAAIFSVAILTVQKGNKEKKKKEMGRTPPACCCCTPENLQLVSFVPGRHLAAPLAGKFKLPILPASWRSSAIGHVSLWCGAAANHGGPSGLVQRVLDAGRAIEAARERLDDGGSTALRLGWARVQSPESRDQRGKAEGKRLKYRVIVLAKLSIGPSRYYNHPIHNQFGTSLVDVAVMDSSPNSLSSPAQPVPYRI